MKNKNFSGGKEENNSSKHNKVISNIFSEDEYRDYTTKLSNKDKISFNMKFSLEQNCKGSNMYYNKIFLEDLKK